MKNNLKQEHYSIQLDDIDKKILRYLQIDGKASLRTIAKNIDNSVSTVKNHLDHLTNNEVIKYYSAVIDCCKVGYREMLMFSIRVNSTASLQDVLTHLNNIKEINAIYQVSGTYPIFCMAKCVEKDDQIKLLENVKKVPGIEEIMTQVVLQRVKEDMRIAIV